MEAPRKADIPMGAISGCQVINIHRSYVQLIHQWRATNNKSHAPSCNVASSGISHYQFSHSGQAQKSDRSSFFSFTAP